MIDPAAAQTIRTLADETPPSRVTRVRGVLDTLTVSTKSLILRLEDGRQLRGFATDVAIETLKELHGNYAVLEGQVTFRPSGEALPTVFRPRASVSPAGLDAFFGKWPGDETDDPLAKAMKDLS